MSGFKTTGNNQTPHYTPQNQQGQWVRADPSKKRTPINEPNQLAGKTIPPEVLANILSNLDKTDLQNAAGVNSFWKESVVSKATRDEFKSMKKFISLLLKRLPEGSYPDVKKGLANLVEEKKILNATSLQSVKFSASEAKDKIIYLLQTLKHDDFVNLRKSIENEKNFKPYKNVFDQVSLSNNLKYVIENKETLYSHFCNISLILCDISKKFAELDNFNKAIEVANLTNGIPRDEALCNITNLLIEKGQNKKAIEVALMMQDTRDIALKDISISLASVNQIPLAVETVKKIENWADKREALGGVADNLVKNNQIEEAIKILSENNDNKTDISHSGFLHIFTYFIKKGNTDKAIEILGKLNSVEIVMPTKELASAFIDNGNIDKAFQIANMPPSTLDKVEVFQHIIQILMEKGNFDKVIECVGLMPPSFQKAEMLWDTSLIFAKKGLRDKALEMANMNPTDVKNKLVKEINKLAPPGLIDKFAKAFRKK